MTDTNANHRYTLIMAGGSGTRLWPMSRAGQPKQLIPLFDGKSLLDISLDRLQGLVPPSQQYICASDNHKSQILDHLSQTLPDFKAENYLGEPMGRDTLNAVGLSAAIIAKRDPKAVIAIFTADHLIEPIGEFQKIVNQGFELAENKPHTLVTFGIAPTHAATGYGYLKLADKLDGHEGYRLDAFREKPDQETADSYLTAGSNQYLWNSGMFVWQAQTLLEVLANFQPENSRLIEKIADAWDTDNQQKTIDEIYPTLTKISVDYAIMEPASTFARTAEAGHPLSNLNVAAVPMPLKWLDVGSWPSYAATLEKDSNGNQVSAAQHTLLDTKDSLVFSSDPQHMVAVLGAENLTVIHTPKATLICPTDQAEQIKQLHALLPDELK